MSTRTRLNLLATAVIAAGFLVQPAAADDVALMCDFTVIAPALQEEAQACRAEGRSYSAQVECHSDGSMSWIGTCS